MMNKEKKFITPEAEIIEFGCEDVIFTSGEADIGEGDDSGVW